MRRSRFFGLIAGLAGVALGAQGCREETDPLDSSGRKAVTVQVDGKTKLSNYALRELEKRGVPRTEAVKYDSRFIQNGRISGVLELSGQGVGADRANSFPQRFSAHEIVLMKNIPPELAGQFAERYSGNEIVPFVELGVEPEVANAYGPVLDDCGLAARLPKEGVELRVANSYLPRFGCSDVEALVMGHIPPEIALKYSANFNGSAIASLHKGAVSAEEANEYALLGVEGTFRSNVSADDIIAFHNAGISAEEVGRHFGLVERFGAKINANDVLFFKREGIPYEQVEEQARVSALKTAVEN